MSYVFTKGATSQSIELYIIDSTDGTPETGVVFNTAGIDLKYRRKDAAVVSITEAVLTTPALTDTWETGGFLEIGNGLYRLDLPDAALASAAGIDRVAVFGTVTGMVVLPVTIHLTDIDLNDAVRAGLTALPNAAADAAGGLPISDAGGLDLDTKLANTNEVTAARMGALTDWINGGRLDLLLDAIPTTAMRGTDSAALASVCTEVRLAALTDWINGGRLDLLLDAIPTTAMRGTDSAALASVCTEARLAELAAANLPTDIAAIPTTAMRGTDSAALASVCTEGRLAELDAANLPTDIAAVPTVDEIWAKAISDLAQGAPSATASVLTAINYLYEAWRNKITTTATLITVMKDDGTTGLVKSTISDDATTFSKGEMVTGA